MSTELIFCEPGHTAFALSGDRAMVQLRAGAMTHDILDACERLVFPRLRHVASPIGALIVLNGDAQVPAADVRARQQQVVGDFLDATGAFMVSVVEGTSIQASSMRTVSRVLVMGKPRLVHRPDVAGASLWLGEKLGVAPAELEAAMVQLRAAVLPASAAGPR